MKNILKLFVFSFITLAPIALGDDDCTLDAKGLKPGYPEKGDGIVGSAKRIKGERTLEEKLQLTSGTSFIYLQDGCAHYGQTYRFENIKDRKEVTDRKYYLGLMARLLQTKLAGKAIEATLAKQCEKLAPTVAEKVNKTDSNNRMQVWGDADTCTKDKCWTSFGCDVESTCTLTVSRSGDKVSVELIHDFPM